MTPASSPLSSRRGHRHRARARARAITLAAVVASAAAFAVAPVPAGPVAPIGAAVAAATAPAPGPLPSRAVPDAPSGGPWVATWQASPQPVWGPDFLLPTRLPTTITDRTVLQVARLGLGGERLRIVLSNAHGSAPVVIGSASVAAVTAPMAPPRPLRFGGRVDATIAPGAALVSDPVALPIEALGRVAVSLYLPGPMPVQSFHWDGRQTGWLVVGDRTGDAPARWPGTAALPGAPGGIVDATTTADLAPAIEAGATIATTARLLLAGVLVERPMPARAVVVLGDSITDGATASLDRDHRWPDFLAAHLAPRGIAVVNAGISGARLRVDGMGASALARVDRDVFAQPGVDTLIVAIGINDIAWPGTAFAPTATRPSRDDLVAGYRQLIAQARSRGLTVIGTTLAPFEGALEGTALANYFDPGKDALRREVNDWIRQGGAFDAVIDFDAALRDPARPTRLAPAFDSGDHLHPGDAGNAAMADAVMAGHRFEPPAK